MNGHFAIEGARQQLAKRPSNLLPTEVSQKESSICEEVSWDNSNPPWENWHNGPIFENWTDCSPSD